MIVNVTGVLLTGVLPSDGSPPLQPGTQPISWARGAEGSIKIKVVNESGAAVDISAGTLTMSVKRLSTDTAPQMHVAATGMASDGTASFPLVAADTASLALDIYRADFWLTLAGKKSQVIRGSNFSIGESVGP
jgi:hypothetical protein